MPVSPARNRLSLALRHGIACLSLMGLSASVALAADAGDDAATFEFNDLFLHNRGGGGVDLRYFERGSTIAPGSYGVDVYLNLSLIRRHDVVFAPDGRGRVVPLVSRGLLESLGVDVARLQAEGLLDAGDDAEPADLSRIPAAGVEFDVNNLALMISVPQAYVRQRTRGYVDPSLWDNGDAVLFTNYQANFSRNEHAAGTSEYRYLGLRSGLNLGSWRLRNESTLSSPTGQPSRFRSQRTYLEKSVPRLGARLGVGDLYTSGDIFESVTFRGAQLSTDLGMLPDSHQGYAPVVRGIAETNATVEIRQNDALIYSTSVSPGAFEIADLPSGGSNGNLHVRILEADGRVREFSQPYSYLPVMTRPGHLRYSLSAGEYQRSDQASPGFFQGTAVYGLGNNLTGFGGVLASDDFFAVNAGVGINAAFGGMSFDLTRSRSRAPDGFGGSDVDSGYSARLLYAKTLVSTQTTLTMAGYRYSTEGYRTFSQHVDSQRPLRAEQRPSLQKNRFDLSINQTLADNGSLYFSIGEASYWNVPGKTRNWRLGYSGNVGGLNYNLAVSHDRDPLIGRSDRQVTGNISVPLGRSARAPRLTTGAIASRHGPAQVQAGVSGSLDRVGTATYSFYASHTEGQDTQAGATLGWDTPVAQLGGSYQYGRDNRHLDLTASGSVVVHRGGVTLGQPVGETFGLLEVPRARSVGLQGWNGVRTDRRGYAVVPYLQPYRMNWLNVDTSRLSRDVEISGDAPMLVPTRGAMAVARYGAETGRRVQFALHTPEGRPVPFGAMAYGDNDKVLGMVDNLSRVLAFGVQESGTVRLRWNGGACEADYRLPARQQDLAYERVPLTCTPMATLPQ